MNTDLVKSMLSLGIALIPLLVSVVAWFRNRTQETTELLDSPSLKVLKIIRHPVNEKQFQKIQRNYLLMLSSFVIISLLLYFVGILLITFITNILLASILFFILILFLVISAISGLLFDRANSYRNRYWVNNALDARYYLFQDAEVVVEADYSELFKKSFEILKSMSFKVVEANGSEGILEASIIERGRITVKIEKIAHLNSTYLIRLKYTNFPKHDEDLPGGSKFTNRFIDLLISKPKKRNEQAKDKREVATDVGNE